MARRPTKKRRETTRKPLTDARKQELFSQILSHASAEAGRPSPIVEADEDDRAEMREDDAIDVVADKPRRWWHWLPSFRRWRSL